MTKDPDGGDKDDPLSQNPYAYAKDNPVNGIDPDGQFVIALPLVYAGFLVLSALIVTEPQTHLVGNAFRAAGESVAWGASRASSWVSRKAKKGYLWARKRVKSSKSKIIKNIKNGFYPTMWPPDPDGPKFPKKMRWYYKAAWWAGKAAEAISNHFNGGG